MGQAAGFTLGPISLVLINDMDQQNMKVTQLITRSSELQTAARHAIYAIVTLILALRELLETLCFKCQRIGPDEGTGIAHIPEMREFFDFAVNDKRYVMRKCKWP